MGWIKLLFYFMVIYFNYSVLRTDILLGVGLIAVEVIIVGKFKGGSGSNRGFFKKDSKKIEKLVNKLIMLELLKKEDNSINDEELESSIRYNRTKKSVYSDSHKQIKNIFGSSGLQSKSSSNIILADRTDVYELVDDYHNKGDFRGITRTFLGLIRLLSVNLIFQTHGNFNPPNMKKCYPYFDRLGKIFSDTYNINYLTDQLPRLKMIELGTEKFAEDLPPQVLQEYSEFLIDLYFYIKDFNPDFTPDSKENSTSQSNPRLKSQSYRSDLSDDNIYGPFRRFLLSFALFIGICGVMILSQIFYLPVTSQVFLSPGIMFFIVSAVSVYISRKI